MDSGYTTESVKKPSPMKQSLEWGGGWVVDVCSVNGTFFSSQPDAFPSAATSSYLVKIAKFELKTDTRDHLKKKKTKKRERESNVNLIHTPKSPHIEASMEY